MKIEFTVFSKKKELTAGAGFGLFLGYVASLIIGQFFAQTLFGDQQDLIDPGLNPAGSWDSILYVFGNAIGKVLGGSLVLGFVLWHLRKISTKVDCFALGIVRSSTYLCGAMFLLGLALNLLVHFFMRPIFSLEAREISAAFVGINDINEWIKCLYILELTIMAPVIEEFLFRGVLYNSFINSYGQVVAAIATTFLFAIVHFNIFVTGNWIDVFYLFLISSALLAARQLSGSLLPSIFMHSGANSTIVFPVQLIT